MKAADGKTDIYGLVYRPSDFSPEQSYPVVSDVFSTPDFPWVPKGSFSNNIVYGKGYMRAAALAELGFIVVQIDGRGASFRDKAFQDTSYGWIESASCLEDHIAGICQLAERYPFMDLTRVGINSLAGGTGAVQALLQHPDFYRVGVARQIHDSRLMATSMWSDMFEGLAGPDASRAYPEAYADKLQGPLLITAGMLDGCTLPSTAFRVIGALQKANKSFDMLVLPNLGHDFTGYAKKRQWDYFVTHLLGEMPPEDFKLSLRGE